MTIIALEVVNVHFAGEPYLESLVIAILPGVTVRHDMEAGRKIPGIAF